MARKTAEEAQATRERIVRAAAAAFAGQGFVRPTLAQIAADAGVTRGAVYFHFANKRALFSAVCDLIDWPVLDKPLPAVGEADPLARLRAITQTLLSDIEQHPLRRRVLEIVLHKTEWSPENEELLVRLHRSNEQLAQAFEHLLSAAVACGELSLPVDARSASLTMQAALLGLVSAHLRAALPLPLSRLGVWLVASLTAAPARPC